MRRGWRAALLGLALLGTLISGQTAAFAQEGSPAASPAASPPAACAEASRETMEKVARVWHEDVYATKDPTLLGPYLSPDIVHHAGAFPDAHGPEAVERLFTKVMTGFPDARGTVDFVLVDAPYAAAAWTVSGTNAGEFQGMPPTGRHATWHGLDIYRFECGKVVESWTELDQLGRWHQLGLLPLPQATPAATSAAPMVAASPVACAPTPRDEAAAIARSWWNDVWNGGERDAPSGLFTDDVVHHWGIGPDTIGPAAMAARLASLRLAFPDLTVTHGPLVQDGDYVAATWVIHATQTGEHPTDIAATGEPVTLEGIDLIRIDCGRIAEIWTEMDAVGMLRQLGAMPAATPEAD